MKNQISVASVVEIGDLVRLNVLPWSSGEVSDEWPGQFVEREIKVETKDGPVITAPEYVRILRKATQELNPQESGNDETQNPPRDTRSLRPRATIFDQSGS